MKIRFFKIGVIALLSVFFSCSKESSDNEVSIEQSVLFQEELTPQQINNQIKKIISDKEKFYWSDVDLNTLWNATNYSNHLVTIGYGNDENDFEQSNHSPNILNEIFEIIKENEETEFEKIVLDSDPTLNIVDIYITDIKTLDKLRKNKFVRYIEPANYKFFDYEPSKSGASGCGYGIETLNSSDYVTITPNAKVPWNFYKHNIPDAWNLSSGSGITIGVIDSGVSPEQSLMGSQFNNGASSGRSIRKYGTYVDSFWLWSTTTDGPNDKCGHGTSMTSTAVAPRNDRGLPVGVAYNANLVSYRAASNVVLDGYHEQKGVQRAFVGLGDDTTVKIISMSMGHIFSIGRIEDGVRYAFNRGKLIFCAGGTSTSFTNFVGVIFPAWMNEAVAVTGIREGVGYNKCSNCHSGSKIDFTIVMERQTTSKNAPVLSYYDKQSNYVGGSSVATATTAGIAALVWSKHPSWNRDQVLSRLKQSSSLYPTKSSDYGYGNINAYLAVQ